MHGFPFWICEAAAHIHNCNVTQLSRIRAKIQSFPPRLAIYILPYGAAILNSLGEQINAEW